MIISSKKKIEYILRQYTESVVLAKPGEDVKERSSDKHAEGDVAISNEGKKRMRVRFQNDVINYLRTKY